MADTISKNPVSVMMGSAGQAAPGSGSSGKKNSSAPASMSGADAQTTANRVNQNTPFGNTAWAHNPDGTWTQNTSLSPGLQGSADSLEKQMQDAYSKPMDDGSAVRDQVVNSMYGQAKSRLDPMWDHREAAQQAQLANQGLDSNSEAYRNGTAQLGRDRNDAYTSAMNGAIGMGNQAQATTFAQNLASRNAPMEALQGLRGFTGMPGYSGAGDYMQQQMLQQQMMADALKAGGQLTSSVAGMAQPSPYGSNSGGYSSPSSSYVNPAGYDDQGWGNYPSDERIKQNIQRLPMDAVPGVPFSLFEYRNAPGKQHLGVIAQDLERVAPQHVSEGPDGVKHVSAPFKPFAFK